MPQLAQPPEIPAIVQPATAQEQAPLDRSSNRTPSTVPIRELPTGGFATPTQTETLAPESSALETQSPAHLSPAIADRPTSVKKDDLPLDSGTRQESVNKISPVRGLRLGERGLEASPPSSPTVSTTPSQSPAAPSTAGGVSNKTEPLPSSPARSTSTVAQSNEASVYPSLYIPGFLSSNSPPPTPGTPNIKRLVSQQRGGEVREFEFTVPTPETQPSPAQDATPRPNEGETSPSPRPNEGQASPSGQPNDGSQPGTTVSPTPFSVGGVLELTADRQEYDEQRKVVTATGNVILRFREALLDADRVEINLPNRLVVAEGNVALTRGNQVLRGERFEYYFVQDSGVIFNANGQLYTPTAGTDLTLATPTDGTAAPVSSPVSNRITSEQPLQGISNPGGYSFVFGAGRRAGNVAVPSPGGTITQLRYQAERVDFDGRGAIAQNVRITNDPFSPPELEFRADKARFTRLEPLVDEIVGTRPRLVFDQRFSLPLLRNRITIDRRPRDPALITFGYDGEDRGGLYAQSNIEILNTPTLRFTLSPQYFIQRAIFEEGPFDPSVFGLRARLDGQLSPRTSFTGRAVLTTLDLGDAADNLRANFQVSQIIGTSFPHTLSLEYAYRDRIYNGSLGYQTVRNSIGAVLSSPVIPLGNTGIDLTYQASAQYINAETDRVELLEADRTNDRVSLGRFLGTATLSRGFTLWRGQGLPPTPTEGLRYTPAPVVPYLQLFTSATGVASAYTSGDTQNSLSGTIGLVGQFGHFSKPFLDYTGFNISYTQVIIGGQSPFLFDREVDTSVVSAGITQQIWGPFRFGVQTSFSINRAEDISTDFLLEYSRRTYNILLRYNPTLQLGSISFRINDFNWSGNPGLFDDEVCPVVQGVNRCRGGL
jgi:lipopolysaccharide export system protein LptA